jgi:hypothetical protein
MDASTAAPASRRALAATVAVAVVMALVVFGGYAIGGVLSTPVGAPVDVAGVVALEPLSGWEVAARFEDPPRVRLTRGGGNLDVVAVPWEGSALELADEYVKAALEPEAHRLSVSREAEPVTLASGLRAVRFAYVGSFGKAQVPIEGEVTAVVSPSGVGAVFDGWGPEGLLRYVVEDLRTMIELAEVA